ncbi:MAG TPA: phospholipase D-like domain-containing protein [Solirubrobacteraceae bacterium]|nr:phospholipase D-like domain-containing protein [Solirubrobacteraceae bacterium]
MERTSPRRRAAIGRAAAGALFAAALSGCSINAAAATPATPAAAPAAPATTAALLTEPGEIAPIYRAIAAARTSVDMTMYELEDPTAERALAAAAQRGVKVRVLLDGGYAAAENAAATAYLLAHGVEVRSAPSYFALTHEKTLTIDRRRSLVMTLNLTARYYANTRDFAVWDSRAADVAEIEAVFDADWSGRHVVPTAGAGDLLWSPGAEGALLALIARGHTSVTVENEEMADQPVVAALCRAARRGARVHVVMSVPVGMTYASEWTGALRTLARCGAKVHLFHGERPLYIHAKVIVVDGARAYVGSQNFSYTSLARNRELGLITADAPIAGSLAATVEGDYRRANATATRRSPP